MQIIPESEFRQWLADGGIVPHSRWGSTDTLVCAANEELSRFWFPSFVPSDLPGFLSVACQAASPEGPWYMMRRGGGPWFESDPDTAPGSNVIIDTLLHAAGVPDGAAGALRFTAPDWKAMSMVAIAHYVYGWSVGEDLHIVGEERDCAMMMGHHGELTVHFPSSERLDRFAAVMLTAGYDLPVELPDRTFKSPSWLKGAVRRGTA